MKASKLKLHKIKIVKLTQRAHIFGGSENTETTYTTTGNDDTTTNSPTSAATSNQYACNSINPNEECPTKTNDTTNGNNSVPTFNQTIEPGP
ncbi:hypothetical protein [uncultured Kordia sp.]|uniref:hypothetical protein n=1 Tax=uncultured Kordia sp. TaxID=507699 RepID=UPI00262E2185|nr:hypothetical protein [uncultured Kordia sp.]